MTDFRFRVPSLLLGILLFTAPGLSAPHLSAADPDEFDIFNLNIDGDNSPELPGRLLLPVGYDPSDTNRVYPLVVFYHGSGQAGTDNRRQVNSFIDPLIERAKQVGNEFFLYAPQGPSSSGWSVSKVDESMIMVANALAEYHIDASQIYVTGLSLGGGATKTAISRYTENLAGAVVAAGIRGHDTNYEELVGFPVWLYHARNDGTVGKSISRDFVNGIRIGEGLPALSFPLNEDPSQECYNTGAPFYPQGNNPAGTTFYDKNNLRYTEFVWGGHGQNVWHAVYGAEEMYDWLLGHAVGDLSAAVGDRFLFDFGNRQIDEDENGDWVDSVGQYWNSTGSRFFKNSGVAHAFAKTTNNDRTKVNVSVTGLFQGATKDGDPNALHGSRIGTDGWATARNASEASGFGELTLSGLTAGAEYSLEVFATNTNSDNGRGRTSRYQVGAEFRDLEAYNNLTNTADFSSVLANANGEIVLKVFAAPGTSSRFGQINTLELEMVSLGGGEETPPEEGVFEDVSFDHRNDGSVDLPGKLYVPAAYDETESWPLVIFFHGESGLGSDNSAQVGADFDDLKAMADLEGILVYAPQLSGGIGNWNVGEVDRAIRVAATLMQSYNVDFSQVYTTGFSIGGAAVWNSFSRYPGAFAAALPIAGRSSGSAIPSNMVGLPIWAWHSRGDAVSMVSATRGMVNDVIVASGGTALSFPASGPSTTYQYSSLEYTELDSVEHAIWSAIYSDPAIAAWLSNQSVPNTAPEVGESLLFDFGNAKFSGSDSEGRFWNSTDKHYYETAGTAIPFAGIESGRHTSVSVQVNGEQLFGGHYTRGVAAGTGYDHGISSDGWLTERWADATSGYGQLEICGLVPGTSYEIEIFATHSDDDRGRGRMSRYEVGGVTADLNVHQNVNESAIFSATADVYGMIAVKVYVTPGSGSRHGQINLLKLRRL